MDHFIPLSVPNFEGQEVNYVTKAVGEGWVSTGGAYITEFEEKMAAFLQVEKAVAVQSGTAALHLALRECDVMPHDAVFVPTITFIAAVNPVAYQFANPIFVDADDSLCMDPNKLRDYCENQCEMVDGVLRTKEGNHAVKAIVVVHVFGNMADMEAIMDIASTYHLRVVEDATEALGTRYLSGRYAGKYAGTIGDFGAFSFNGNKIITTGGGGMLVAKNLAEAKHVAYISTQAKNDPLFYIHDEIGFNYRMTNVQAALGVAQMEELPEFLRRKRENHAYYRQLFAEDMLVELMEFREGTESNAWFYSLKVDMEKLSIDARTLVERLAEKKIGTRLIWGLISEQKPYRDCAKTAMEKAPYYASHILNIPCSTNLTKDEMEYVAAGIREVLKEAAK
ncbi:aminotransferase, LLPSF_NHT_00031 family [Lachnospiraceae bacterium XBB1006]|nr:aminotransferase, LLPSF_NHT_00031 family [Lachnospiraceae bacterium XBB1006]